MNRRKNKIELEAAALWRQLHGEPPPECADGSAMLDLILRGQPVPKYERLANPYLRPSNVAVPRRD